MANMVEKYTANCEAEQKKIEEAVSTHTSVVEKKHTTLPVPNGER